MSRSMLPIALLAISIAFAINAPHVNATMQVRLQQPPTFTSAPLPPQSRLYYGYDDDSFIQIPSTKKSVVLSSAPPNLLRSSVPSLQQHLVERNSRDFKIVHLIEQIGTPDPADLTTLATLMRWAKSPMMWGFLVLGVLAFILKLAFAGMDNDDLKELSRLSKGGGFNLLRQGNS